jgi:tRNA pseudouridine55 synthase
VLPLGIRSATKLIPFISDSDKVYVGTIRLGEETDTLDAEGTVLRRHTGPLPDEPAVRAALARFVGEIEQVPPMFSAVKQDGVPLHRLARQGREVERQPKQVRIDRIELLRHQPPNLEVEVECSAGTYVRVLAADLGAALGCGGHLSNLCRTRSGPFVLPDAATSAELASAAARGEVDGRVIPAEQVLGFPILELGREEILQVKNGGEITAEGPPRQPGSRVAALGSDGRLLAVLEVRPGRRLRPLRVVPSLAPEG